MRLGINLRGDLAKLSDGEIAARFDTLIDEREALFPTLSNYGLQKSAYQTGLTLWFGRGPLHARIFYELYALFTFGPSFKMFRKYDLRPPLSAGLRIEGHTRRDQAPRGREKVIPTI